MLISKHQNLQQHTVMPGRHTVRNIKYFSRRGLLLLAAALTGLMLAVSIPVLTSSVSASSHVPAGCPGGPAGPPAPGTKCPGGARPEKTCDSKELSKENCPIVGHLLNFINALSAAVGVIIVIMITVGGIQYSASADNPQAAMAAKKRVYNAVFALLAYIFLFSFLQWVVPGGAL